ncbi:uncharacterized protein [Montipora capricornis]|uniref:uncharacterized protein n=1 Tax=Montipora capricornis TaxID=246305 RepID=UPI0035F154C2
MTHILTNPDYSHNHRFRSKSAVELRDREKTKDGISKTELDTIRSLSRQSWKNMWEDPGNPLPRVKSNHFVTTYSATHNYKALRELTPCRPSSPTRRNNPHPTRSFLRLHLRQAKGFPKAKEKLGQDPYDEGYEPDEPNDAQQTMYYTLWEMKDKEKRGAEEALKAVMNPKSLPAAQAWVKNASLKDKTIVADMMNTASKSISMDKTISTTFKPDVVPAVNRWLKKAGREEQEAVIRLMRTLASDPIHKATIEPTYTGHQHPDRYILGKYKVHQPGTTQMHVHVQNYFPKKSHFKANPAWLGT